MDREKENKKKKKNYTPDSEPQRIVISDLQRYLESNTV